MVIIITFPEDWPLSGERLKFKKKLTSDYPRMTLTYSAVSKIESVYIFQNFLCEAETIPHTDEVDCEGVASESVVSVFV